ncbi:MAG: riboflavin synthase, partial [Halieaceae bacterium]|nr:riboflavin synthase [Halieaceae bacterium]
MFTGIIQAVGEVVALQPSGGDLRLRINTGKLSLDDLALGDSICTNGVCLTVVELPGDGYWADVSVESLNSTTLGKLKLGARVNLEKAMTPVSRLGGHIVSGHVDGVGDVVSLIEDARSIRVVLRAPAG